MPRRVFGGAFFFLKKIFKKAQNQILSRTFVKIPQINIQKDDY
jgi:hypothetical protein